MAKQKEAGPAPLEYPGEQTAEEFRQFLDSIPAQATAKLTLLRIPSELTPDLIKDVRLAAPQLGAFEDMVEWVRRRHGTGEYILHVSLIGENGKRIKYLRPSFRVEGDDRMPETFATDPGRADGPTSTEEVLDTLRRALNLKAQAAEVGSLTKLLDKEGDPASAPAGNGSRLKDLVELVTVARQLFPQTNPLDVIKQAKELLGGGGSAGTSAEMLSVVKEVMALVRDLRGSAEGEGEGRGGSVGTIVVSRLFDLAERAAPYLPQVAQAIVMARGMMPGTPGAPTVTPRPEAVPAADPLAMLTTPAAGGGGTMVLDLNHAAVLQLVGGNAQLARGVEAVLDEALDEARRYAPDQDRAELFEMFADLVDLADRRAPGMLGQLMQVTPEQAWGTWTALDPRLAGVLQGRSFLEAFLAYLKSPPADLTPSAASGS